MAPTRLPCWVCSLLCVWSVAMGHPCSLDRQVRAVGLRREQGRGWAGPRVGRAPAPGPAPQRGCPRQQGLRAAPALHSSGEEER